MADSLAREFVKELEAALKALTSTADGFKKLLSQIDEANSADVVRAAIAVRVRRKERLDAALSATIALLDDDYPKMPKMDVEQSVHDDVKDDIEDQLAAFREFAVKKPPEPEKADRLNPSLGAAVPRAKPPTA